MRPKSYFPAEMDRKSTHTNLRILRIDAALANGLIVSQPERDSGYGKRTFQQTELRYERTGADDPQSRLRTFLQDIPFLWRELCPVPKTSLRRVP